VSNTGPTLGISRVQMGRPRLSGAERHEIAARYEEWDIAWAPSSWVYRHNPQASCEHHRMPPWTTLLRRLLACRRPCWIGWKWVVCAGWNHPRVLGHPRTAPATHGPRPPYV